MNKLVSSLSNRAYTANNAITNESTLDVFLDLFSDIGNPLRDSFEFKKIIKEAYEKDMSLTLRLLAYGRDILEGTGRRDRFISAYKELLSYEAESKENTEDLFVILLRMINSGMSYWKDMFKLYSMTDNKHFKYFTELSVYAFFETEPDDKMHLSNLAKWMPRKGELFNKVRILLGVTPKELRKWLVANTNVVENKLCARDWDSIDFSKVPGRALKMYNRIFSERFETSKRYLAFLSDVANGKEKMNVGKTVNAYEAFFQDKDFAQASFKAMLDALDNVDKKVLVVSDTSGSMTGTPMKVCVSLTALFGTKLTGDFHNCTIPFSSSARLVKWKDSYDIKSIMKKIMTGEVANTDLQAVFDLILNTAISKNVPQEDMPNILLIISDMQFDQACYWDSAYGKASVDNIELMRRKYKDAGYDIPQIIFWNVSEYDYNNKPITKDERGIMVSGFSQNIWNSMMKLDLEDFTPYKFMLETLSRDRYVNLINPSKIV